MECSGFVGNAVGNEYTFMEGRCVKIVFLPPSEKSLR